MVSPNDRPLVRELLQPFSSYELHDQGRVLRRVFWVTGEPAQVPAKFFSDDNPDLILTSDQWAEFSKLPAGTLYSKRIGDGSDSHGKLKDGGYGLWSGLFIKGNMCAADDHYEGTLLPVEAGYGNVFAEFDPSCSRSGCEGVFLEHQYAIYGPEELGVLAAVIAKAIELTKLRF